MGITVKSREDAPLGLPRAKLCYKYNQLKQFAEKLVSVKQIIVNEGTSSAVKKKLWKS